MSRFRFRAWDEEAGDFTYSFVEDDNYIWGFEDGKLKAWAIQLNPGTIDESPHPESVELKPPEQSTGLIDKSSVEIFGGDVVDVWFEGYQERTQIFFNEGCFVIHADNNNPGYEPCLGLVDKKHIEIIGNIDENPGMLQRGEK